MIVAIIPARGGSKGVPRKNLKTLAGKPLVVHSIEQAFQSDRIARVFVSTDDPEIAALAESCGAEVVLRPAEISGDAASSESALLHVLETLRREQQLEPELVVFLQATSPLRRADDIEAAIETLEREQADSLFTAYRLHGFVWRRAAQQLAPLSYDHRHRPRRQEAPEDLVENGALYLFKPWVLHQLGNRLGGKVAVYLMPEARSFQVDAPHDLELIETLMASSAPSSGVPNLAQIALLVLDFDGVMTDDRVLVHQDGGEAVWCHRGDGFGIQRLRAAGVRLAVLSKETNPVVAARCRKLDLPCFQGFDHKLPQLQALAQSWSCRPAQIAFMGNDVNDLECMAWAGVAIAVADADPKVRAAADFVTRRPGGRGAVREICDLMLEQRSAVTTT